MCIQVGIQRVIRILLVAFFRSWIQPVVAAPSLNAGYSATKKAVKISVSRTSTSIKVKFPASVKGNTFRIQV